MADWFIATEGGKVVKDSASLWPQIITAVSSAGAALIGVWYGQWLITRREAKTAAAKKDSERLFIATELVFILEEFAEGCARAATDTGHADNEGILRVSAERPDIDLTQVAGDWRVLPAALMYRIRELPILVNEADKYVASVWEHDWSPDYSRTFEERQYQYARAGLKALFSAIRLRRLVGLPGTRLNATPWSAQPKLWNAWKEECRRRSVTSRPAPELAVLSNIQSQPPSGEQI